MESRYRDIQQKVDETGRRITRSVLYPPIPRNVNDIYVITTPGDRIDLLAYKYYGEIGYWWIIAEANAIGKGSMALPVGQQIRIPTNIGDILQDYRNLNS